MRDSSEGLLFVRVHDKARYLTGLVRNYLLMKERRQRQVGERKLGRDTLFVRVRGKSGQLIAAAQRGCLRQQIRKIPKVIAASSDRSGVHVNPNGCLSRDYIGRRRLETRVRLTSLLAVEPSLADECSHSEQKTSSETSPQLFATFVCAASGACGF